MDRHFVRKGCPETPDMTESRDTPDTRFQVKVDGKFERRCLIGEDDHSTQTQPASSGPSRENGH